MDEWKLLRRSGLAQVSMGADTGSPKVLKLMNKDFQKLEMIYDAAETLHQAGVRPSFNMIFGYPGEGETERRESVQPDHGHLPARTRARSSGRTSSRRIPARRS